MKLVIGLGNPGSKYVGTRHNVGFNVVSELARRFGVGQPQTKFQGEYQDVLIQSEKILLIAPQTFMNRSGESVWQFVRFYQPEPVDIVVVCDDMNLPTGRLRWRSSGSAGGQKGLNDIIQRLGHDQFPRLRIGVGRPPGRMDVTAWVLGRFREDEKENIEHAVVRAADSVERWIAEGIEPTMVEYNRQVSEG
ncbi:MAG: aminoacyl-tRNA hydrolase [Fuerstiella sp.]|nr:aminoacyl-tRNA hydrolase [Fuerstiella sp.]MCP4857106.1 aminoacyl-tRNA hydrolase [Fuerstiella sp.]